VFEIAKRPDFDTVSLRLVIQQQLGAVAAAPVFWSAREKSIAILPLSFIEKILVHAVSMLCYEPMTMSMGKL